MRMHGARRGISCFRARPCADFCICVAQRGNCFAPSCGGLPACAPFAAIFAFVGVRVKVALATSNVSSPAPDVCRARRPRAQACLSPFAAQACIEGRRIPFAIFLHVRGEPFQLLLPLPFNRLSACSFAVWLVKFFRSLPAFAAHSNIYIEKSMRISHLYLPLPAFFPALGQPPFFTFSGAENERAYAFKVCLS